MKAKKKTAKKPRKSKGIDLSELNRDDFTSMPAEVFGKMLRKAVKR